MNKITWLLACMGISALFADGAVLADGGAIQTMARITMHLNHFPTDEEKADLEAIVDSDESSEEEAAIAMALANMQHKVSEKDAARLADIVDDDTADADARELAGILLRVNHKPSDEDRAALSALAAG